MNKRIYMKKFYAMLLATSLTASTFLGATPMTAHAAKNTAVDKEEMVYVLTDGEGNIDKIIVNDELKNEDGESSLTDESDLTNIENVKGDETFTQDENALTWDAGGNDISYQGNATKELPVDVKISYKLDGKDIAAKDLAGKSGKVSIRFDYVNKTKKTVKVNGKKYKVSVPFTMISGMILDGDRFSNVLVENGKAINQGNKIIVFGYATPGLKESLGIGKEIFKDAEEEPELPEYVEITADVKDFELSMTLTAATADLFSDLDLDGKSSKDLEKDFDDMKDAEKQLLDGADQLVDGAGSAASGGDRLATGANTLAGGLGELSGGIDSYTAGVGTLRDKSPALINGVKLLDKGASDLYQGSKDLEDGVIAYVEGTKTLAGALNGDGTEENPGYLNGVAKLKEGVGQLVALKDLGELHKAIQEMKAATSDNSELGIMTLGGAANTLNQGISTMKKSIEDLGKGTTAGKLKEMAGAMQTANSSMSSAQTKINNAVDSANSSITDASSLANKASGQIVDRAEKIGDAKEALQTAKSDLADEVAYVNEQIDDKNQNLKDAVYETNENIDSAIYDSKESINGAIDLLNELKSSLPEDAQGDYDMAISGLEEAKGYLGGTHAETGDSIEKISSDISIDIPDVDAGDLGEIASDLEGKAGELSTIDITEESGVISSVAKALEQASGSMGEDPFEQILSGLSDLQMLSGGLASGIKDINNGLETISSKTESLPDVGKGIEQINEGFETLTAHNEELSQGATQLSEQGDELIKGAGNLKKGAGQLAEGTSNLVEGAKQLSAGIKTLDSNSDKLSSAGRKAASGAETLAAGSEELADGLQTLLEGTQEFRDGIQEFDEKAIQKLLSLYEEDILGMKDRFKAIQKAGEQYQTYTGLAKGKKGNVKFVYRSGEIKK